MFCSTAHHWTGLPGTNLRAKSLPAFKKIRLASSHSRVIDHRRLIVHISNPLGSDFLGWFVLGWNVKCCLEASHVCFLIECDFLERLLLEKGYPTVPLPESLQAVISEKAFSLRRRCPSLPWKSRLQLSFEGRDFPGGHLSFGNWCLW